MVQESVRRATRYWEPEKIDQTRNKLPIISFDSGMFGKDLVKIKGLGSTFLLANALKNIYKISRNIISGHSRPQVFFRSN
ncbi:hypothetical protein CLU79DRAFT_846128 [Phycomyces nitens]|nr:hypothetical protein CLU79DRAFT_846128 [Phycomyces nitens]